MYYSLLRVKLALLLLLLCVAGTCPSLRAQTASPTAVPAMLKIDDDGQTSEIATYSGGAPLRCRFEARAQNVGARTVRYEWQFLRNGTQIFLTRYDENTNYDFLESGSYEVKLLASFIEGTDTIAFEQDTPFNIVISESKLEMPNAFTPNGDGVNDVFRAKEGYQSIVSFKATIFNRGGKQLYQWNDPAGGWDGTAGGRDVPDGAYYLLLDARGADGVRYQLKQTINLLRRYNANASGS